MSADIIQAEYETLEAIAGRFMRQAELTQQMENKLRNQIDNLTQTGWVGQGAEAFRREVENDTLPAWQRLYGALEASHQTTLEITHILRTAEEEAAALFGTDIDGAGFISGPNIDESTASPGGTGGAGQTQTDDNGSPIWGWISDKADAAGNWIVDNRDGLALGGALIAAGIATVVTGGTAAPIIAGVVAAGGITLAINGASSRYPLFDGVTSNMFKGGMIGLGMGKLGTGVRALGKLGSSTSKLKTGLGASSDIQQGISKIIKNGGLDVFIPNQYEAQVHEKAKFIEKLGSITDRFSKVTDIGNRFMRRF